MFDIAWSELLLIAVVALIFIGPKELPQVLHNLGRMSAKLRRSADDFRRQFEDSMREAGYEDLHKNIQDIRSLNPTSHLKETIDRAVNQTYAPKPSVPADPQQPQANLHEEASSQIGAPLESPAASVGETIAPAAAEPSAEAVAPMSHWPDMGESRAQPEAVRQPAVDEAAKDRAAPVA